MSATLIGQLKESADKLDEKASELQMLTKKKKNKHKYYEPIVKQASSMPNMCVVHIVPDAHAGGNPGKGGKGKD